MNFERKEANGVNLPDISPILNWYQRNKRDLPWRHTRDPYAIWVSEIMLQQTRVEAVLPYYARFLSVLPDTEALAAAPEEVILKLWEGLGYYSRVRNMQRAARQIMAEHQGIFPTTFAGISSLCGIGPYTAGAIASFAFGLSCPAVDGNVLRVAARLLAYREDILSTAAKKTLTAAVAAAIPAGNPGDFNQALIELGALVCLPNGQPKCDSCPLAAVCEAKKQGLETTLPLRKKPAPRKKSPKTVLILRQGDRIALRQRPKEGLLAGLFEPYCIDETLSGEEARKRLLQNGLSPLRITPLGEAKHIFTHLEWHMVGYEVILDPHAPATLPADCFFAERHEIDGKYALPSAFAAYRAFM